MHACGAAKGTVPARLSLPQQCRDRARAAQTCSKEHAGRPSTAAGPTPQIRTIRRSLHFMGLHVNLGGWDCLSPPRRTLVHRDLGNLNDCTEIPEYSALPEKRTPCGRKEGAVVSGCGLLSLPLTGLRALALQQVPCPLWRPPVRCCQYPLPVARIPSPPVPTTASEVGIAVHRYLRGPLLAGGTQRE